MLNVLTGLVLGLGAGQLGRKSAPAPPPPPREYLEALEAQKRYTNFLTEMELSEYQRYLQRRPEYEAAVRALAESFGYMDGKFTSPIYRPEVKQMVDYIKSNEPAVRRRLAALGATPETIERVSEALQERAYQQGVAAAGEQEYGRRTAALQALGSLLQGYRTSGAGLQAMSQLVGGYGALSDYMLRQQQLQFEREQAKANQMANIATLFMLLSGRR